MSEWQPIETAPKDGTNVLLVIGETIPNLLDVRVGSYLTLKQALDIGESYPCWLIFHPHGEDWFVVSNPTHWMPLPEATK